MLVKALKNHRFDGADRAVGDIYTMLEKYVKPCAACGMVEIHKPAMETRALTSVDEVEDQPRVKRRYRRRDMTAEGAPCESSD